MARKRDGLVPVEEAISDLDGPVKKLRNAPPPARPLHPLRSGEPVDRGQRSGPRHGLHGAADGAVLAAPHQPRQPERVCPSQRPVHAGDDLRWESKIELSEKFFNEIINHPVPIDMNTLKALKRCSLGLDLYLWLVYRTFTLRAAQQITWRQVYQQFGLHPAKASDKRTVLDFRRKVLRELKKIKLAWPGLNYSTAPGILILHPSTPVIAPLNQGQLGR